MSRLHRAVFLDRDGTIGGDGHFIHPDEFVPYPESYEAIKLLNEAGWKIIVITNQHRIAKGDITLAQLDAWFQRLNVELANHNAHLDVLYICPHSSKDNCECQKPSPYLLQKAAIEHNID